MSEYYLLADYLPPNDSNNPDLKQYPYEISPDPRIIVHVVFLHFLSYGLFLIEAPDIWEAYGAARAIQAMMTMYYDLDPSSRRAIFTLTKVNEFPQSNWDQTKLAESLESDMPSFDETGLIGLQNGTAILGFPLGPLLPYLSVLYQRINLYEAAMHLIISRQLVFGGMSESFYQAHYLWERHDELDEYHQTREYLENRAIYELSFVAAFKAIERFFEVNSFKKHEVDEIIDSSPYPHLAHDQRYSRRYEILLGLPDTATLGEMIKGYLDLRNMTAAHANRHPPKRITQEHIFEIQNLIIQLLKHAITEVLS